MFDLTATQAALREFGFDGWLLHDFRGSNVLARRILELDGGGMGTRRFFYMVPAQGEPLKLVHRIESGALDHLPGRKTIYLRWQELEGQVACFAGRGLRAGGDGIFPEKREPLHRPGRCGDD